MKITINDTEKTVADGTSVASLIKEMYPEATGGIAVSIGNKIVRKADWESRILCEGDDIVIIRAAYGG